ncbi:MAG TPA: twin-arginine translocase subunit TatC [Thermoanaerobaculia bacterium]|nr:twin-arginine translocase subunit TatC [Thermoanaerobaculia bacterium]
MVPPTARQEREPEQLPAMSLLEHLEELRNRLMWVIGALGVSFGVCWWKVEAIFDFLAKPAYRYLPKGQKLVILSVTDALMLYIKVALLASLFAAAPVILYHLWKFIRPGLYSRERYYALGFIVSGSLLFLSGGAFAYYVAFPFSVEFLLEMGRNFTPAITGPSYLSFLMTVILGLALMFELPLVIVFLARVGLVTPRFLLRNFRWAVLVIFAAAAIITPTSDVFNLCLFAVPTLLLYLLGVAAAAMVGRAKSRAAEALEAEEAAEALS